MALEDRYPTWPHLENLYRIQQDEPGFLGQVGSWVVTEKIHGFNARFGVTGDGEPWVGSRNLTVATGDPDGWNQKDLQGFVGFAAERVDRLSPGEVVFGEWAGKGIQKGIDYGERRFYAFGFLTQEGRLAMMEVLRSVAEDLDMDMVPVLRTVVNGPMPSMDVLDELRDGQSSIVAQPREGIVITSVPVYIDRFLNPLIAKHKSAAFAENSRAAKPPRQPVDMTVLTNFIEDYATPQRMQHVLAQVSEANGGVDPLLPAMTGFVLKEMYADIVREAGSEFEALSESDQKGLGKALVPYSKALLEAARDEAMRQGEAA